MDDKLKFIFDNVNNWLKFNEAKNAILITMAIALIVCDLQFLKNIKEYFEFLPLLLYFLVLCCLLLLIALYAQFAILNDKFIISYKRTSDNLLYYGTIATMDAGTYLYLLWEKYYDFFQKPHITKYQIEMAEQIVINSKIALRKALIFNFLLKLFFGGILLGIVIFIFIA